ncbi:MAG: hypothetical protein SPF07_01420 [Eubacteriales bacterium]|nr:hypothetical protein [Eubacteriales bacterium]
MKKGYYSLLALPLVATMFLAGCGKTTRNALELKTLHAETVSAYDNGTTNTYFKKTGSAETEEKDYFVVQYNEGITNYQNSTNEEDKSTDLYKRYNQLKSVYGRTMSLAYAYYADFRNVFYENIESKKPDAKELTELYDRLKTFQRELASFNANKLDLERETELFGAGSSIIGASVDKFNYSYTNLIKVTLNFVNYFKDLHVKYFYSEDQTIDKSYALRVYDEGLLSMANYIYKGYLNSLVKNGTAKVLDLLDAKQSVGTLFNPEKNKQLNYIIVTGNNSCVTLKENFLNSLDNGDETNINAVKEYESQLNMFNRYFKLYNKVYDKVDMEKYNTFRFNTDSTYKSSVEDNEEKYLNSLSVVDSANARVMINFEKETVPTLLNALQTINS